MLVFVILAVVLAVSGAALAALLVICVGRSRLAAARSPHAWFADRLRGVAPFVAGLGLILLVNKGLQGSIQRFSDRYGIEATGLFYTIEGDFVSWFQQLFPAQATLYFSAMYVFGYVVLLTFPLVAYLFSESITPIKTLVAAYAINYGVAVIFYASVYAYGPRNFESESTDTASVSQPLFELFPDITLLTSLVNSHTNVFPSLHTSLSVTVLLLAGLTHEEFPRWTPIAAVITASIVASTMYLGIHWLVDVIAGVVLAVASVYGAQAVVARVQQA